MNNQHQACILEDKYYTILYNVHFNGVNTLSLKRQVVGEVSD